MRSLVLFPLLVALTGCPGETDVAGCPRDPSAAVGTACTDEGQQCGEISTCEECTSDPDACHPIECVDGAWAAMSIGDLCDG